MAQRQIPSGSYQASHQSSAQSSQNHRYNAPSSSQLSASDPQRSSRPDPTPSHLREISHATTNTTTNTYDFRNSPEPPFTISESTASRTRPYETINGAPFDDPRGSNSVPGFTGYDADPRRVSYSRYERVNAAWNSRGRRSFEQEPSFRQKVQRGSFPSAERSKLMWNRNSLGSPSGLVMLPWKATSLMFTTNCVTIIALALMGLSIPGAAVDFSTSNSADSNLTTVAPSDSSKIRLAMSWSTASSGILWSYSTNLILVPVIIWDGVLMLCYKAALESGQSSSTNIVGYSVGGPIAGLIGASISPHASNSSGKQVIQSGNLLPFYGCYSFQSFKSDRQDASWMNGSQHLMKVFVSFADCNSFSGQTSRRMGAAFSFGAAFVFALIALICSLVASRSAWALQSMSVRWLLHDSETPIPARAQHRFVKTMKRALQICVAACSSGAGFALTAIIVSIMNHAETTYIASASQSVATSVLNGSRTKFDPPQLTVELITSQLVAHFKTNAGPGLWMAMGAWALLVVGGVLSWIANRQCRSIQKISSMTRLNAEHQEEQHYYPRMAKVNNWVSHNYGQRVNRSSNIIEEY
ncbi:hypothetical protein BJ742DRAFT_901393 [Cladochytrium replicatum]|nr:hypothetical protein BJ742DRAFT_901393 [Cladochytrium replicatum]